MKLRRSVYAVVLPISFIRLLVPCKSKPPTGCAENEICLPSFPHGDMTCKCPAEKNFFRDENNRCLCRSGFYLNDTTRNCENATNVLIPPTDGSGNKVGGKTLPPVTKITTKRTTSPTSPTEPSTTTTKSSTAENIKVEPTIKRDSKPWVYTITGLAVGIVFITLIIGIAVAFRKTVKRKKHCKGSFSFQLDEMMQTMTTTKSGTLYRPYMNDIGSVVRFLYNI